MHLMMAFMCPGHGGRLWLHVIAYILAILSQPPQSPFFQVFCSTS